MLILAVPDVLPSAYIKLASQNIVVLAYSEPDLHVLLKFYIEV